MSIMIMPTSMAPRSSDVTNATPTRMPPLSLSLIWQARQLAIGLMEPLRSVALSPSVLH